MGGDINDKQAAQDWQSKKSQYSNLDVLIQPGDYTLARLPPSSSVPSCVLDLLSEPLKTGGEPFFATVSRTHKELSVLISTSTGVTVAELEAHIGSSNLEDKNKNGYGIDGPWKAFRIRGPMEFHLVGVLLEFSRCLAQRSISIFAVSTWDTDYICVKEDNFAEACAALREDGWNVLNRSD